MTPIQKTQELGVEFWNDSCALNELAEAVEQGATGATSNPVIVGAALDGDKETWHPVLRELIRNRPRATEEDLAWALIETIAVRASAVLKTGRLCVQVNPTYYRDPARMITQGRHFATLAKNIAVKVPATEAGLEAIEELSAAGIPVNATVSFTVSQAIACAEAMERGIKRAKGDVQPWVTLMIGRIDDHIKRVAEKNRVAIDPAYPDWAGIAVFKEAHRLFKERGFKAKLLSAAYRHPKHWSELIGPGIVQSIPYTWWKQFNASKVAVSKALDRPVAKDILEALQKGFPEFRQAFAVGGLEPRDFVHYGATIHTLDQFISGYHKVLETVRKEIFLQA